MSFLKELKEDLGQAMNELISDEATEETVAEEKVNEETVAEEEKANEETAAVADDAEVNTLDFDLDTISDMLDNNEEVNEEVATDFEAESQMDSALMDDIMSELDDIEDEEVVDEEEVSDEVTEITKGTVIEGNISSNGSLNVYGKIKGNVSCKGKLMIAGVIVGESSAKEIFVNNAKVDGDVKSEGTIKIANGSVIIGNVYASSAVVAGAVKGDIDVHGPVIVDGTAVVKGDIKSRSVQINNGAAIEGFCSQCYADIDYKTLFDETFGK